MSAPEKAAIVEMHIGRRRARIDHRDVSEITTLASARSSVVARCRQCRTVIFDRLNARQPWLEDPAIAYGLGPRCEPCGVAGQERI
jgi:hypothetical protein